MPLTRYGRAASSTNPDTWTTLAKARASSAGVGVGFVLNGDGIVCLDLDHCLSDGVPSPEAADFLQTLPRTYIEVSPSGHGLHVWGLGHLGHGFRRVLNGLALEAYGSGRYVTVTENVFRAGGLADLTDALALASR